MSRQFEKARAKRSRYQNPSAFPHARRRMFIKSSPSRCAFDARDADLTQWPLADGAVTPAGATLRETEGPPVCVIKRLVIRRDEGDHRGANALLQGVLAQAKCGQESALPEARQPFMMK